MANTQHIEWLLEGVESWNARRKREGFRPDLGEVNLRKLFDNAGKLTAKRRIPLGEVNLNGADLRRADLRRADLRGADLRRADLGGADLGGANLWEADLRKANLRVSNLWAVDLGGADLDGADLGGANLGEVDVRTLLSVTGTNDISSVECTDLSTTIGLTQKQIESMWGDSGTILPDHRKRPALWGKVEARLQPKTGRAYLNRPADGNPENADETKEVLGQIRTQLVQTRLVENREALILSSGSLLAQIAAFKNEFRKSNALAAQHPETYAGVLSFLDQLADGIHSLAARIPSRNNSITDNEAEEAAGFLSRFFARSKKGFSKFFTAENLGDAAAPASIIMGCGSLGYLATGFNPLGFGAGTLMGKFITQEMKPGAATDKLEKLMQEGETPPE